MRVLNREMLDAAVSDAAAPVAVLLVCSFEYFDKDRSNSLNYDEILCALQHAGGQQHTPERHRVHSSVDPLVCWRQ
jgi:hypothetical protein